MRRPLSPPRGFTLLEILVALVIFVMSVAAISRLVTLGLDNADFARLQSEGMLFVENRFAEIDADSDEVVGSDAFPGWTTETATDSAGGDFLYRITVTATHSTGVKVVMTRFFFDQTEAEEAAAQANSASSQPSSSGASSTSGSAAGGS